MFSKYRKFLFGIFLCFFVSLCAGTKVLADERVIFMVDASGSMSGHKDKVLREFESFLRKLNIQQDNLKKDPLVTIVTFNDNFEYVCKGIALSKLPPSILNGIYRNQTQAEKNGRSIYVPSGGTSLYDTIVNVINKTLDGDSCGKYTGVQFVIFTDGIDVGSSTYCANYVKSLIRDRIKNRPNSGIRLIGWGVNSLKIGIKMGIDERNCFSSEATDKGFKETFDTVVEELSQLPF